MPVLPCRPNTFLYHNELYQFLSHCQQNCAADSSQIVSISLEVESVDPLVVLQEIAQPNQLSFYFENKSNQQAIAAIDAVAQLQTCGVKRFSQAQKFVSSCLDKIIKVGTSNEVSTGPHFFCSFSFFNETSQIDYPFPAATIFLPRWQISRCGDRCILVANFLIDNETNLSKLYQDWCQKIRTINLLKFQSNSTNNYNSISRSQHIKNIKNFKQSITSSLKLIESNYFQKIVLAHPLDVSVDRPFDLFQSLENLRNIHPGCYIFAISNGKGQNFIGASPERLISINNQQLSTDALAGSAPRGKTLAEDTKLANCLLSSEKERYEHCVVLDFITQCLYQLGIVPQVLSPRLRQLSNIQHLWTPIQATLPTNVHPLEIVAALHPTPAVAGVSRDVACTKIQDYERFERGLYAAPLGWLDDQGNCEFIVGIRSALIDRDRARLYAGAGIVAGSNPDREIAEIQLKLQALLKALV
ncbi:isochorismate synthase [Gloeocapsopsis dulcis]|uniref:isochorismate synthase n=1 Tax=Gloeocapsopsis dulcis AAB1 = 1H9 TaxID=1433147 RepID=A0A6N8FU04_9CHRO|nr:isochorismate synthase [Gloeocapsopsis dulcis]MUL36244.1 isochorismate synthase [Gloeocapsopsis dulcis AAB1 = 1H9]WNN89643.1 isochorismate synthase [Gloeocapsopsis dulcis]